MKTFALNNSVPFLALSLAIFSTSFPLKALADGSHKGFNVKTYGATGNGTTDDTSAIQAAITAAGSGSGNTVLFPAGTYLYSGTLVANGVTFQGQSATLLSSSNSAYVVAEGTSPTITGLGFNAQTNETFAIVNQSASNAVISGNSFSSKFYTPISVNVASFGTISNNSFALGTGSAGVELTNAGSYTLTSNTFNLNSGASGVAAILNQSPNGPIFISSNTFNGSSSTSNNSTAVVSYHSPNAQVFLNTINGWQTGILSIQDVIATIYSNTINNTGVAIALEGTGRGTATANIINTTSTHGIVVAGNTGALNLVNNTISNTGRAAIYTGTYQGYANGGNLQVTGSTLNNAGLSTSTKTTAVINVNQTAATSIVIANNQYKGNTTNVQYFIDAHQAFSTVTGNKTNTLLPNKIGP